MEQMLRTREKQRLPAVALKAGDAGGVQHGVPRTPVDPPPHLRMVVGEDADAVPLMGERRRADVGLSPIAGDSSAAIAVRGWFIQSLLVEAMVRHEAGHGTTAEHALERALEFAAHDRVLLPFVIDPVPELLERHARRPTAHAELISEILELRAGLERTTARQASESPPEALTETETRILRLLATDLSKREIGNELYVSVNTVKTHVRHLYAKLDVRTRRQAVERARALGLLTYSLRSR
jgi:LuxR family transcriptional regulator, maltose regulon positive regulatory protein